MEKKYYSPQALATLFEVTPRTVQRMIKGGELRSVWFGSQQRVPQSALDNYLSGRDQ